MQSSLSVTVCKKFKCFLHVSTLIICPGYLLFMLPFQRIEIALSTVSVCLSVCHENLMLAITLPFLNTSLSNNQIILLMTTWSQFWQIIQVKVTFAGAFIIITKQQRGTQVFNWTPIQLRKLVLKHILCVNFKKQIF